MVIHGHSHRTHTADVLKHTGSLHNGSSVHFDRRKEPRFLMQDGVSTHIFSAVRPLTSLLEACHAHDMARGQAPLPVNKKYLSVKNLQRGGRRRRGRWLQPNRRPGARLHLACVYVALASCASIGSARYTHCYVTLLSFLFCFRQLSVLTFPVAGGLRVHEFACACMFACGVSWLQCACLIMMAPGLRPPLPPDPTTENGGGGGGGTCPAEPSDGR